MDARGVDDSAARPVATDGLDALERRLAHELKLLSLPARPWMRFTPAQTEILDVVVIGAGMAGLTATAALRFNGVESVLCIDRAPAGVEGPWITTARMRTLRTPKDAMGPALGIPSLTFRAWFEAQYGGAAWDALGRIPRAQWMDYLIWYRRILALPVRNNTQVTRIEPRADGRLVDIHISGAPAPVVARRVVLATGLEGMGVPVIPAVLKGVARDRYSHSSEPIEAGRLHGRRVAVIGAGASAMDNAAFALEAGAAHVDLLVRRAALPAIDIFSALGNAGLTLGYQGLPDEAKLDLMRVAADTPVPPPRESVERVIAHRNVTLHLSTPIMAVAEREDGLTLTTGHGTLDVDTLILATGFRFDPAARPELAPIAPHILRWRDVRDLGPEAERLGDVPYLAADFALRSTNPSWQDRLARIHCFTFDAVPSAGRLTSGVPAISEAAQRLTRAMAEAFLREDREQHLAAFHAYDSASFPSSIWPADQIA